MTVKHLKCNVEGHTVTECERLLDKDRKGNGNGGTNEGARQ